MLKNPLLRRYRYSQLRPRQIGIYTFIYVAIVAIILLMNYTIFTTLRSYIFGDFELPFTMPQAVFYQLLGLQVIILWVWASYNSGTVLTREILNKSYVFFKLLPITALQKALGVLFGTNLIAYPFGLLNFVLIGIFAYFGRIRPLWVLYDVLCILAVAAFLNTMTLLLSINPDAKHSRRIGTLIIIGGGIWALMTMLGILLASGRMRTNYPEEIIVTFFEWKIPGMVLFSLLLFYFAGWVLLGILRKFEHEREPLFSLWGSFLFALGYEVLTAGIFWPYLLLKSAFYGHQALCFWAFALLTLGSLRRVDFYFEHIRKIQKRPGSSFLNWLRFFRHTSLGWGIGLFGLWMIFYFGLSRITRIPIDDLWFPLLNLFGFYLFFIVLQEVYVLYRHLHLSIKVFLIFVALVAVFLPIVLFQFLQNKQVYLHSAMGYMANLITPFLIRGGNATVQWRVLLINLFLSSVPLVLIISKYRGFFTLRKQM